MHWSPDVLTAMTLRGRRRYDPDERKTEEQRPEQHAKEARTAPWANEFGRPDYGCVDWFVYGEDDEQAAKQEDSVV